VKLDTTLKNANAIVKMLGLRHATNYGGRTNNNAIDAQKEIRVTFETIMSMIAVSEEFTNEEVHDILLENRVR